MYEPKNSIGADHNLRAINDLNKRKRRHQNSMHNKLDPLLSMASNYESKLSRAANERGHQSGSFYSKNMNMHLRQSEIALNTP